MSPFSSRPASCSIVASTTAAGTISQTARGRLELGDEFVEARRADGPLLDQRSRRRGMDVVDDAFLAVAQQPPHHVRAHPTQTDHPELHGCLAIQSMRM